MRTTIEGPPGFRQCLGWDSEMSCPRKLPQEKTKRIQSSPTWQPPGYDPQALPLSHIGPMFKLLIDSHSTSFSDIFQNGSNELN